MYRANNSGLLGISQSRLRLFRTMTPFVSFIRIRSVSRPHGKMIYLHLRAQGTLCKSIQPYPGYDCLEMVDSHPPLISHPVFAFINPLELRTVTLDILSCQNQLGPDPWCDSTLLYKRYVDVSAPGHAYPQQPIATATISEVRDLLHYSR